MIWDFGEIIAGLVLLVVAGDLLVKGAVAMSLRLGIPALIVGLTVVAFGTSAPELMVSVAAVLDKAPSMALGNVVGSNIFNLLCIIGVAGLFGDIPVPSQMLHVDLWVMAAASIALAPFIFGNRVITRGIGIAFTAAYLAYMVALFIGGSA